jgi:hypothetical protein
VLGEPQYSDDSDTIMEKLSEEGLQVTDDLLSSVLDITHFMEGA